MRSRKMFSISGCLLTCTLVLLLISGVSQATSPIQQDLTPTPAPIGITVIQDRTQGLVQLFSLDEVAARTGIRAWQDAGWTGYGVHVGVLDRGFGGLLHFEETSGVDVDIHGEDKTTYDGAEIVHGTRVLEVLHGIAPGARLHACTYETFDDYTLCIDQFIAAGVHIINHSAGMPALPLDGTNEWAKGVDRAAYAGVLWVNAAGNFARGYVQDFFTDTNLNGYHEFRGFTGIRETLLVDALEDGGIGVVMLSWQGAGTTPANSMDLDLHIVDAGGGLITASMQPQSGNPSEQAIEYVAFDMGQTFGVQIRDAAGAASGAQFVLFIEFANLETSNPQRSIIAPGDSRNALTVGALQGVELAPYSSRGPLITDAIKPDLVAPGEIELDSGMSFVGTSAAAPVVAGAAALVWEVHPDWSQFEIMRYLRNATQDDYSNPGPDPAFGWGRLFMPAPENIAVSATPTMTPAPPTSTIAPGVTPTFIPAGAELNVVALPLIDDFEDGDTTHNPEWDYWTSWSREQNPRFGILDGELHSDGEEAQDSSDRWLSNLVYRPTPPIQTTDYLEFSFRGLLKSVGNPQQGRTVQIQLYDHSTGKTYILFIGKYHGYGYSPLEFRLYGGQGVDTLFSITAGFSPEFDRWYEIKTIRQNGILHLYVNGSLVDSVADPVGLSQISDLDLDLTGSVIVDDVILIRAPVAEEINGVPFVYVPAGCFMMGSVDGNDDERPVHEVCLSAFWISQTEVTNDQYRACVNAGVCDLPGSHEWCPEWDDQTLDGHPVVCVDWSQAEAYAKWLGGSLPTEAQWEYAARGPASRVYSWGDDEATCELANISECARGTTQAGSYPDGASWVGALDMAGNVWEWVADWYSGEYYSTLTSGALDPAGPESGDARVFRGGSFRRSAQDVRAADRFRCYPTNRIEDAGFRVVVPIFP